jgi:hypothetical protein
MFSDKHLTGNTGLTNVRFTQTGPGQFSVTAPQQMGVWKVYVYAYDGQGNVGIEQRSFRVVPPTVAGTNAAQGKPVSASSYQPTGSNGPQLPSYAADGNFTTRWASNWTAAEWIQVDLGQTTTFNHIQLAWESAYAKSYQIQLSTDGTTWQTAYSTSTGDGGFDDLALTGSARYVRMNGTERGTAYGYSLWEFGIYKP